MWWKETNKLCTVQQTLRETWDSCDKWSRAAYMFGVASVLRIKMVSFGIFLDAYMHDWGGGEAKEKKVKPILTPPSFFSLLFLLWYLNHNTEHKHCRLDLKLLVTLSYKMTGTHWSWIHFTDSTNTCHQSLNNAVKAWNHHHTRSVFLTTYCDA